MKKNKNKTLSRRLITAFLLVSIIGSISGLMQLRQSLSNSDQYSAALTNYGFSQGDIGRAMLALTQTRSCLQDMINAKDSSTWNYAQEKVTQARAEHDSYTALAAATLTSEEDNALLSEIHSCTAQYYQAQDQWIEKLSTSTPAIREKMRAQVNADLDPIYDQIYNAHDQLLAAKTTTGDAELVRLDLMADLSGILGMVIIVISLVVAVVWGIRVSRSISRPLIQLMDASERMAQGDLDIQLDISSQDEIGRLGNSFNKMTSEFKEIISDMEYNLSEMAAGNFTVESSQPESYVGQFQGLLDAQTSIKDHLSSTLSKINDAADQVAAGSEQVSNGSQALSLIHI